MITHGDPPPYITDNMARPIRGFSAHGDDLFSMARCAECRDKLKYLIAELYDEAHAHDHD